MTHTACCAGHMGGSRLGRRTHDGGCPQGQWLLLPRAPGLSGSLARSTGHLVSAMGRHWLHSHWQRRNPLRGRPRPGQGCADPRGGLPSPPEPALGDPMGLWPSKRAAQQGAQGSGRLRLSPTVPTLRIFSSNASGVLLGLRGARGGGSRGPGRLTCVCSWEWPAAHPVTSLSPHSPSATCHGSPPCSALHTCPVQPRRSPPGLSEWP